eukprot:2892573-Rhodomonas_salina.1
MAISYGKLSNYFNAQRLPSLGPKMNTNTMIITVTLWGWEPLLRLIKPCRWPGSEQYAVGAWHTNTSFGRPQAELQRGV